MEPTDSSEIRSAILMGMLAMMIMTIFVIIFVINYQKRQIAQQKHLRDLENRHQKLLLDTALNSEEAERRRIAQDLHDDVGTMLSLTKFSLAQVEAGKSGPDTREEEEPSLQKARKLLDETIAQVRRLTSELVPTTLERFGLSAAIEEFLNKIQDNGGIQVKFGCNLPNPPRQAKKVELALYRVTQELVNNAIKHSDCDQIDISLHYTTSQLALTVKDNGKGFDEELVKSRSESGHGLRNIESRMSIIDGTIAYQTEAGKGCSGIVRISL